jgi:hypothetical protein
MLSFILVSPFLGFLSGFFFGFRLGFGVCFITASSIFCSFLGSLVLLYQVLVSKVVYKINLGK